ncbi:hypothetical protein QZH41_007906 [Actinostola sp. cb2023]|nr:hypothetical protein QZH41_007906 [Actinostola sp. cb2023]
MWSTSWIFILEAALIVTGNAITINHQLQPITAMWSTSWLFILEAALIVTGNAITLVIFTSTPRLRSRKHVLIVNLAVADLFVGLMSVPMYVYVLEDHISKSSLLTFYKMQDPLFGIASLFGLAALSIERAYATFFPFKHRTLSKFRYAAGIAVVWACALSYSVIVNHLRVSTTSCAAHYCDVVNFVAIDFGSSPHSNRQCHYYQPPAVPPITAMWSTSWIFILEAALIVTGNAITLVIFTSTPRLRSRKHVLIVNLAVADLFVGLMSVPMYVYLIEGHIRESSFWTFYMMQDLLFGIASLFGLAALSIERAYATFCPFKHRTLSKFRYAAGIAVVWACAICYSVIVNHLREEIRGNVVIPSDKALYENEINKIWNARLRSRRPSAFVKVKGKGDVVKAVKFCVSHELDICVYCEGKSDFAIGDDAVVIDLSGMCRIKVDENNKHFKADNLVLCNGEAIKVSAEENPDLFWAMKGHGYNFGIVTGMQFQIHEMPKLVVGGAMFFQYSSAKDAIKTFRDYHAKLNDNCLSLYMMIHISPTGFRCGPVEHPDFQKQGDYMLPSGRYNCGVPGHILSAKIPLENTPRSIESKLKDEVVDNIFSCIDDVRAGDYRTGTVIYMTGCLGGKQSEGRYEDSSFPFRGQARYWVGLNASTKKEADFDALRKWCDGFQAINDEYESRL